MDIIIEEILGLIIEGSIEVTKSKKMPKIIRIIFAIFLVLFFSFVLGAIFIAGIFSLKDNLAMGLFCIALGIIFLISMILKVKNAYKEIKERK
jgi:hypothetical protein